MKDSILKKKTLMICGIEVAVEWKKIKNMYLKVHGADGSVTVSAPAGMSLSGIRAFVEAKESWLKKHLAEGQGNRELSGKREFRQGEILAPWGEPRTLVLEEYKGKPFIKEDRIGGEIRMYCRFDLSGEARERIWKDWCRQRLAEEIPKLIRKWEPRMQVKVQEWRIRDMKTRWGSCNITKGRIWLSLQLAEKPKECLEEVVVHEMVHLLEPGHNKRFYHYMDCFLPQWKTWKERLKNPL